jgi:hypothetical protein
VSVRYRWSSQHADALDSLLDWAARTWHQRDWREPPTTPGAMGGVTGVSRKFKLRSRFAAIVSDKGAICLLRSQLPPESPVAPGDDRALTLPGLAHLRTGYRYPDGY